jgi:hypothetical protein
MGGRCSLVLGFEFAQIQWGPTMDTSGVSGAAIDLKQITGFTTDFIVGDFWLRFRFDASSIHFGFSLWRHNPPFHLPSPVIRVDLPTATDTAGTGEPRRPRRSPQHATLRLDIRGRNASRWADCFPSMFGSHVPATQLGSNERL